MGCAFDREIGVDADVVSEGDFAGKRFFFFPPSCLIAAMRSRRRYRACEIDGIFAPRAASLGTPRLLSATSRRRV